MFRTSIDYHDLNAGAHRNSPKNLYAPTLTQHLAIWLKKLPSDRQPNLGQVVDPKKKLDDFLLKLCRALKADESSITELKLHPCVLNDHNVKNFILFKTVADDAFDPIDFPTLTGRQRDILESSSRAVTIEFKWHELCMTIRCEMHTEYFSITTFAEVEKNRNPPFSSMHVFNKNVFDINAYFDKTNTEKDIEVTLNRYFFREFWTSYSQHVLAYSDVAAVCKNEFFDRVFADFRGIILSEKAVRFKDSNGDFFYDKGFFDGDDNPTWGSNAKKAFMPFLNARNVGSIPPYECSVTYMLDGRAIYMSALAPQLLEAPDNERIPLEFLVYAHQHLPVNAKRSSVNKWELGRLVNQLNLLGTLRLAALKDVKLLRNAGKRLSELDQIVQDARDSVALEPENAMGYIQNAHVFFNEISSDFLNKALCGITYRIERSRYYVAQFRSNVKALRIKKLEGDQTYDQFVERRLGAEFDFIDRLGRRYERQTNSLLLLDQNYLSIETNEIDDDTNKIDRGIHKIQEWGEFALLAALVPYYLIHIFSHVIQEEYVPIMTIVTWVGFVVVAIYRKFGSLRYSVGALCFVALLILPNLLGVDYSPFLRFPEAPSEPLKVQRAHLLVERAQRVEMRKRLTEQLKVQKKLLETQIEQLKTQTDLLGLQTTANERQEGGRPHAFPKHQNRSVQ